MSVEIYIPTVNEVTQAVYNLSATEHLEKWAIHLNQGTRPLIEALQMWDFDPDTPTSKESRVCQDDYIELNPLAHAPRPLDILDHPGDLVLDDSADQMTILHVADKDGNPVESESIIETWDPIPFNLIPPDDGIYYMVKKEEINGKIYSFYRPCHPTDKPEEGEELIRLEKPLKPIWPDILRVPPEPTISEVSLVGESIRKPIPEGSYYEPSITLADWGPDNFQFKF